VISVNLMHCPGLDTFASRLVSGAYATEGGGYAGLVRVCPSCCDGSGCSPL